MTPTTPPSPLWFFCLPQPHPAWPSRRPPPPPQPPPPRPSPPLPHPPPPSFSSDRVRAVFYFCLPCSDPRRRATACGPLQSQPEPQRLAPAPPQQQSSARRPFVPSRTSRFCGSSLLQAPERFSEPQPPPPACCRHHSSAAPEAVASASAAATPRLLPRPPSFCRWPSCCWAPPPPPPPRRCPSF